MSLTYRAVGWNPQKRAYDVWLGAGCMAYLAVFAGLMLARHPSATFETIAIRGLGTLALLLLHVILSIGPLCRLDRRFLPLLYNRRHLGVTMGLLAFAHAALSVVQFHGFADTNPIVSLLTTSGGWSSVPGFPFQIAGAAALVILGLMAVTSHDFWLQLLTPVIWKRLHMLVYLAYALLIVHVAFGALQSERAAPLALALSLGLIWIVGLHLVSARKEAIVDRARSATASGFIDVCRADEIPEGRARVVTIGAERVAVFRYDGKVSALSNVCRHQNGPLGEGKIVRGCVVCPWHGYEYQPESGAAPPPFTEKVATYTVQIRAGRVQVDPRPHPPGTRIEPARIVAVAAGDLS